MKIQSTILNKTVPYEAVIKLCSCETVTATRDSALTRTFARKHFQGKPGQICSVIIGDERAVIYVGIGPESSVNAEGLRRAGGNIVKALKGNYLSNGVIEWPNHLPTQWLQSLAEGMWLADYSYLEFKDESDLVTKISHIDIAGDTEQSSNWIDRAAINVLGVVLARDLVNRPSNHLTPLRLVEVATDIADQCPNMDIDVLNPEMLAKNRLNALLAVAKGSDEEPYLIHLAYKPKQTSGRRIAVVGKGITFDSGGISIKPSGHIEDMKIDMAGAATVLGLFKVLTFLELPVEIHGIIPTCENMPSGHAIKPGDIVTSHSGKTIEIVNTDAEGRLILADALSYTAEVIQPDTMIDLATLTGACMVALGADVAAIMSHHQELVDSLVSAAAKSGENLWQLPLVDDYKDELKGDIADLKNVSEGRNAGAINGGLFLAEFVPDKIRFAHIDIAGPAQAEKAKYSYLPKGGTGFGVRTLVEWLSEIQ